MRLRRGCRSEDAAAGVTTTNEFGVGCWRLIERFGVEQDGSLRACDNAKQGRQNECARVGDRLLCEKADLPALMADMLYRLCGGEARCKACTDDLEKAYWRVPNAHAA